MDTIAEKAWEVFRSAFQDGEDVVVEDEWGRFFYGKLRATDEGVYLTRIGVKTRFLEWDAIAFIAHDGFPVQLIMGMTPEEAIRRANQEPTEVVREVLKASSKKSKTERMPDVFEKLKEMEERLNYRIYRCTRTVGGGCPWMADQVDLLAIYNEGNSSPAYWYWPYDSLGEVMVFGADDGAMMHSYDSEHLFLNI